MNPFRAIETTAGCIRRVAGWVLGLIFGVVGLRLLWIAPDHDPVWAAVGMAVACLLTAALGILGFALERPIRRLALLWFLYLLVYLVAMGIFFPR